MKDQTPGAQFPWQLAAIVVAICTVLTAAAYALGVRPIMQRHEHESRQLHTLQERRATASKLSASVASLQSELGETRKSLEQSPVRLQPATLINQRLEALARLATECGVALDEMRPGGATDSTHYQTVPIRIVGSGTYPACANFLRNLRRTFGDVGVRSFTASYTAAPSSHPVASFQAELVWFTELPRK